MATFIQNQFSRPFHTAIDTRTKRQTRFIHRRNRRRNAKPPPPRGRGTRKAGFTSPRGIDFTDFTNSQNIPPLSSTFFFSLFPPPFFLLLFFLFFFFSPLPQPVHFHVPLDEESLHGANGRMKKRKEGREQLVRFARFRVTRSPCGEGGREGSPCYFRWMLTRYGEIRVLRGIEIKEASG